MTGFAWWNRLQAAEAKVVARVRAAIVLVAGGGLAPLLMIDDPKWVKPVAGVVFAVCVSLALLLRAGQDNGDAPKESAQAKGQVLTDGQSQR